MKGVIAVCLQELIATKHGGDAWAKALEVAGLPADTRFYASRDVEDEVILGLFKAVCTALSISFEDAADAFGLYWVTEFAPKLYPYYFRGVKSAREFLLKMDDVHAKATKNLKDARPPKFTFKWQDEQTLLVGYESDRDLVVLLAGLVKGVGKRFREELSVEVTSPKQVKITFR